MHLSFAKLLLIPLTILGLSLYCPTAGTSTYSGEGEEGEEGGNPPSSPAECGSVSASLKKYLLDTGYNEDAASGIMGNIKAESGYRPRVIQGGRLVDEATFVAYKNGGKTFSGGFGLAQWTTSGRVRKLQEHADSIGKMVATSDAQFSYLVKELGNYRYGPSNLNSKSIEESTFLIYRYYETPLSSFCHTNDRAGCYNDYAPSTYASLSPTRTRSAYQAFTARLKYAKEAKSIDISSCTESTEPEPTEPEPTEPEPTEPTETTGALGLQSASGLYSQNDYSNPWRQDHSSIKSSGCSLIAVANALKVKGHTTHDPVTLANWSKGVVSGPSGTGWGSSLQKIGSHFGLNIPSSYLWSSVSTSVSQKEQKLREALASNKVVIISGARKDVYPNLRSCSSSDNANGKCVFSYNGHFAVIVGITSSGKVVVGNPANANDRTWVFPMNEVLKVSNKAKAVY